MNAINNFIIKPFEERYNNVKNVGDKELVVNTDISEHSFVSKKAVVVSTPTAFKTNIKKGDIVYVHHNIFRRWYNVRGEEKDSASHFKDDLYFADITQIYMVNLKCNLNYCFVKPIKEINDLYNNKEKEYFGILKYSNNSLKAVGLNPGALVVFTPYSEFEFIVEGERLYCMKSNDIALTYEHEGNEEENNPSWAKSY